MKTITLKLNQAQIASLRKAYSRFPMRTDIQHTQFQVRMDDCTITVYNSGSVVFQGDGASFHAEQFGAPVLKQTPESPTQTPLNLPMAGSDEVGTGDYFGPITVCAAIVDERNIQLIPVDQITDSKQINDDLIRILAPQIMKHVPYSLLVLNNETYNKVHEVDNMNVIKAKLHNKAYVNLEKKVGLPESIIIDQFMAETPYYKAIANEPRIIRTLHFETKAESKYIAVACAAIIARYAFLESMDSLSKTYGMTFPKGAGSHVDRFGARFVDEFGEDELYKVAKVHFANTQKIMNLR